MIIVQYINIFTKEHITVAFGRESLCNDCFLSQTHDFDKYIFYDILTEIGTFIHKYSWSVDYMLSKLRVFYVSDSICD